MAHRRPTPRTRTAAPPDPLWTSTNPRFGTVRQVLTHGDFVAQFDDLNSDFREICLTIFERAEVGWAEVYSADDVAYPASAHDSALQGEASGGLF